AGIGRAVKHQHPLRGTSMVSTILSTDVLVSAGAIKNGYLCIPTGSDWRQFFEKSELTSFQLAIDGLGTVDSGVDIDRGRFRWRGWRKFYKYHNLHPGDYVSL